VVAEHLSPLKVTLQQSNCHKGIDA
jgi:hypothetical protein